MNSVKPQQELDVLANVIARLDVAWPNQRLGISLGVVQPEDLKSWRIWSLREALSNLNTDSSSQMGGGSRWGVLMVPDIITELEDGLPPQKGIS